jgi:hypothetical protein
MFHVEHLSQPQSLPKSLSENGEGPLAALLVGHRPLRVCFFRGPCQSRPSLPKRSPPHSQAGSKQ